MIEGQAFAAASMIGARSRQEDDWGLHAHPPVLEEGAALLAALADGMGGAPDGNIASRIAVKSFLDRCRHGDEKAHGRLRSALESANDDINDAVADGAGRPGMGATLVDALFIGESCVWAGVGDSRLMLCRDGAVSIVNPLHTFARELDEQARLGEITQAEANAHPEQ